MSHRDDPQGGDPILQDPILVPPYFGTLRTMIQRDKELAAFSADGTRLIAVPFDLAEHNDGFCCALKHQRGKKEREVHPRPWDYLAHVCPASTAGGSSVSGGFKRDKEGPQSDYSGSNSISPSSSPEPIPGSGGCGQGYCPDGAACDKLHLIQPEESYRVLPVHVNVHRHRPAITAAKLRLDRLPPGAAFILAHPPQKISRVSSVGTDRSDSTEKATECYECSSAQLLKTIGSVAALAQSLIATGKVFKDLQQQTSPGDPAYITEEEFLAGAQSSVRKHQQCTHFLEGVCFRGPKCHFLHVLPENFSSDTSGRSQPHRAATLPTNSGATTKHPFAGPPVRPSSSASTSSSAVSATTTGAVDLYPCPYRPPPWFGQSGVLPTPAMLGVGMGMLPIQPQPVVYYPVPMSLSSLSGCPAPAPAPSFIATFGAQPGLTPMMLPHGSYFAS